MEKATSSEGSPIYAQIFQWAPPKVAQPCQMQPWLGSCQQCHDAAAATQQGQERPPRPYSACAGLESGGALLKAPCSPPGPSLPPQKPTCLRRSKSGKHTPLHQGGREWVPSRLPSMLRSASRALPESAGNFPWRMRLPPPGPGGVWQGTPTQTSPVSSFSRKKCGGSSSPPRDDPLTWVAGPWLRIAVWGQRNPKVMRRGSAGASLSLFSVPQLLGPIHAALRSLSTPRFGQRCQSHHCIWLI